MTTQVEHLRRQASKQDMFTCEDMLQAADEIEQLKTVNVELLETLLTVERRLSIEASESKDGIFVLAAFLPEIRTAIAKAITGEDTDD